MKFLCLLVLIFFSWSSFADKVRIYNASTLAVNAVSGVVYSLNVDAPSGDATAETAPATVYLPIKNTSVADYNQYFLHSRVGGSVLDTTTNNSSTMAVTFPLLITVGSTAKSIYSAVQINNNYYVVRKSTSSYISQTNLNVDFPISPYSFCTTFPLQGATNPCSDTSTFSTTMTAYFFVSASTYAVGDQIDVATETDGVYFSLKLSNHIYTSSDLIVSITNQRKGDSRVTLEYSSSTTMSNFSKVKAFIHSSAPVSPNFPIGDTANYAGSIYATDLSSSQSGEVLINNLTNGTTYDVSLFFLDKFNFASTLSSDVSLQPTEIQELLKKQACYLLTAGFGEEHYVTNYFRSYRDHVLANSWLGKKFIKLYYGSAPHYAMIIYKHESLRLMIRTFAYSLYFVFNYGLIVLIFLTSCYFLYLLRKNKILMRRNRL